MQINNYFILFFFAGESTKKIIKETTIFILNECNAMIGYEMVC